MKAVWANKVIAESSNTVVVEGNHYFPVDSVNMEMLRNSTTHSHCPWKGEASCDLTAYHRETRDRLEREAQQLASLTGWDIDDIRARIDFPGAARPDDEPTPWWKRLWD